MEAEIKDLANRSIVALQADLVHTDWWGVAVDIGVAQVAQHPLVVATKEMDAILLIGRALAVNVNDGKMQNCQQDEDLLQELKQLHVTDNSKAKPCHRLKFKQFLSRNQVDSLF